jgi:hypothetical protein
MTEESAIFFAIDMKMVFLRNGTHKWGNETLSLGMGLKKTAIALSKQETRKQKLSNLIK